MNGKSRQRRYSESLVLEDSDRGGVVITGITDPSVTHKSGLKEGDEIVAATIHLNHLSKDDLMEILKIMEPYEDNMSFVTKPGLKASASLGSLDGGLKSPGDMLKDTYSRMQRAVEAPSIEVVGLSGQLNAEGRLNNEINGPTLNGKLPNVTLDTPGTDGGAKFPMPTIGMSGPVMKGADQEGTLRGPKVSLSTPELSTSDASLDLEKPAVKTSGLKYKHPKFKMPHFKPPHIKAKAPKGDVNVSADLEGPGLSGELETRDLTLSAPDVEIKCPDVDLNGPNADLKAPDVDIEAPSGKFKWLTLTKPKFRLSGPKVKGPEVDIDADLSAPDNLSTPNIDGEISAPDVDLSLPKAEVDLQAPDIDIEAPSRIEVSVPDIKGPEVELKAPDVDIAAPSGKLPHYKMPKFGLSGPRRKGTEYNASADVNIPDVEVLFPKVEGEISTPELSLSAPGIEASADMPDLDVNLPEADLKVDVEEEGDTHKSTFKWPFKSPSFKSSGSKGKDSDMDDEEEQSRNESKSDQVEVPMFTFHRLPQTNKIESAFQDAAKALGEAIDTQNLDGGLETAGAEVSLPKVNEGQKVTSPSGLINIMERLKRFKAKTPTANVSLPEVKGELRAPSLNVRSTSDADSSTLLKRGTFKVTKPKSGVGLEYPVVDSSEGNDIISISLSNMLGLNIKEPDADY
ncbi:hypothetical protein J4Q44_G00359020 [Coregonus suidteri]|uniref:PDZ domain-containing protein n=1 Tax=Coregonus suidteri TaxID=861788 RepID=A0AAN8KVX9_9TELE